MQKEYKKPAADVLKKTLTPRQFEVTQACGTEPPFQNEYWDNHAAGIYVDVVTGEPLFSSLDKFDSGTGWPSFTKPIERTAVNEKADRSHGMKRVEVRSRAGDSHLGHVFDDGPGPDALRYCINSAALRFVPVERLAEEGYAEFLGLFGQDKKKKPNDSKDGDDENRATETAIFAGGCFWGMEEIIRTIPGVISTEVGYTGGGTPDPTYEAVKTGRTGHAEAVKIVFDPKHTGYADLLGWFFRMHDPTTVNRQGNDVGTQYRSAIFYSDESQRRTAEEVKAKVGKSGKWKGAIVTQIVAAGPFWRAEEYHQKYLEKYPHGYTCHYLR